MANLANMIGSQGQHDEAQQLEEQVLEIRKRILPENHPHIATSLANLAVTYGVQGEHEKALECVVRPVFGCRCSPALAQRPSVCS